MNNKTDLFNLLRKMTFEPDLSQRELAKNLGFSLGKLNYCIKALNKKGLIKIKSFNNKENKLNYFKRYVLTKRGVDHRINLTINFMQRKIQEYDQLKKEIKK
tara:strand:+ start:526 stop:831 length:306 start_codon:yes stop_codon:yes gene_type:complete